MADNAILTPGYNDPVENTPVTPDPEKYLLIDNYLSEYDNDEKKSVVRENLGVPSKDSVYTKLDANIEISSKILEATLSLLSMEDPYGIIPQVVEMISSMVKTDGSTPFNLPLSGVDPLTDSHLTTKKYVDQLLKNHINTEDPHEILRLVKDILLWYAKSTDVYTKDLVYTINEIIKLLGSYIKNDGTTPFRKALLGVDPELDSHLSTKRYVDKTMLEHKTEIDPHNFLTTLNNRLSAYAKKRDVYDKTLTYSRVLLDSLINKLVEASVELNILDYKDYVTNAIKDIYNEHYVKQDGSTPFVNPLKGVDAVDDNDLVTLHLLLNLGDKIKNLNPIWVTSGPVESTVGHVEDNTEVPPTMTLQEVLDAIFYGQLISLNVPDYVTIGKKCDILLCVRGSTGLIDHAELYQGDDLLYTFIGDDFINGCITVLSNLIYEDTKFKFVVYYTNGTNHLVEDTVKVSFPVFVGLLPKWKFGTTITMDYLIQLCNEDTEGTLNRFLDYGDNLESFTFKYLFEDAKLRHPFIVIPETYPDLESVVTKSQNFGIEAFETIDMIPLTIPDIEKDVIFKIYIYKLALVSLNQEVTFNFKK